MSSSSSRRRRRLHDRAAAPTGTLTATRTPAEHLAQFSNEELGGIVVGAVGHTTTAAIAGGHTREAAELAVAMSGAFAAILVDELHRRAAEEQT